MFQFCYPLCHIFFLLPDLYLLSIFTAYLHYASRYKVPTCKQSNWFPSLKKQDLITAVMGDGRDYISFSQTGVQ